MDNPVLWFLVLITLSYIKINYVKTYQQNIALAVLHNTAKTKLMTYCYHHIIFLYKGAFAFNKMPAYFW